MKVGLICVFTGTMYSGKTSAAVKFALNTKKPVQGFRPEADTRDKDEDIVSRDGLRIPGKRVPHAGVILEKVASPTEVVVIDEGFMLPGLVTAARVLRKRGLTVVVASIGLRFDGTPFRNMAELLCYADFIRVCEDTRCACGNRASFNRALLPMESDIVPGDGERYAPQCALCFDAPLLGEET